MNNEVWPLESHHAFDVSWLQIMIQKLSRKQSEKLELCPD